MPSGACKNSFDGYSKDDHINKLKQIPNQKEYVSNVLNLCYLIGETDVLDTFLSDSFIL